MTRCSTRSDGVSIQCRSSSTSTTGRRPQQGDDGVDEQGAHGVARRGGVARARRRQDRPARRVLGPCAAACDAADQRSSLRPRPVAEHGVLVAATDGHRRRPRRASRGPARRAGGSCRCRARRRRRGRSNGRLASRRGDRRAGRHGRRTARCVRSTTTRGPRGRAPTARSSEACGVAYRSIRRPPAARSAGRQAMAPCRPPRRASFGTPDRRAAPRPGVRRRRGPAAAGRAPGRAAGGGRCAR